MRAAVAVLGAAQGIACLALESGLAPLALPLSEDERRSLAGSSIPTVADSTAFVEALDHPRAYLLDLAPGPAVDELIDRVYVTMEPGDVVIDLSGSYWGDTLRRWRRMRHRAIFYVDAALLPAATGRTVLAGGEPRGIAVARATLEVLAAGGQVLVCGGSGTAHFAQQALDAYRTAAAHARSEVQHLLEAWPGEIASAAVLQAITPSVSAGVRAGWLLDDALHMDAALPLLAHAVMLEQARQLDEHATPVLPRRVGGFVRPEDLG